MRQTIEREIIVIGGGPAGSTAAALMASAGCDVLLLERDAEPRHKVCGEFISWDASQYLEKLGLDLPGLGAQTIRNYRIYLHGRCIEGALPSAAHSLSRRRLDDALLNLASHRGAEIRRGRNVTSLTAQDKSWMVEAGDELFSGTAVFLATGKHDLRGWLRPKGKKEYIGFKMHIRLDDRQWQALGDSVELYFYDGGYVGIEPVEDGITNICLIVERSCFESHGRNWKNLLSSLCYKNSALKERLYNCKFEWPQPLAIASIPYGYIGRAPDTASLYRLGDQMAVIPSFAGDGIAIALHTAFMAANTYLEGDTPASYLHAARSSLFCPVTTAVFVDSIIHSTFGAALAPILKQMPQLISLIVRLTRIPTSAKPY
ncbi:MAG TPA: NAD(P)/FAD-dependent oxidoreductase [Micavibrio sp.]|nr:NAD(P)/FAD-dependent oxidoreductase [Micavibrio sp.]